MSCARYLNPRLRAALLRGEPPKWLTQHPRRAYIVAAVLSALPWVDRDELVALRDAARQRTEETGVEHVLDHIVPLNHPRVCGLTVPWNLQVLTREENHLKGGYFCPEQMELGL